MTNINWLCYYLHDMLLFLILISYMSTQTFYQSIDVEIWQKISLKRCESLYSQNNGITILASHEFYIIHFMRSKHAVIIRFLTGLYWNELINIEQDMTALQKILYIKSDWEFWQLHRFNSFCVQLKLFLHPILMSKHFNVSNLNMRSLLH